jgi:RsiW-degrading membrane proteinase PrsW (M82 family)
MAIRASCSACGAKLKAEGHHAGRTVPCPMCQQPISLPMAASAEEFVDPFAEEAEALITPPQPVAIPSPVVVKRPPAERPLTTIPAIPPPVEGPDFDEEIDAREPAAEVDDSLFPHLSDDDLAGEALTPQKKRKKPLRLDDDEPVERARPQIRPRRAVTALPTSGFEWRQHLHWVLILAILPLVLSTMFGDSGSVLEQIERSLENHPEVNADAAMVATSAHDLAMLFPDHRLDGALLPADTYWHWGMALISSAAFLGLFLSMWPGKESRAPALLITGLFTGTGGFLLLLGFQWVAFATQGMVLRRARGIGALLFFIVQFIGYSYRCALDGESGFVSSFFGFTFGVGLCEELCKALPVAFYLSGPERRSLRAVCLVGLASGVGFGVSEGITYSAEYYNGIQDLWIYIIRFLSCVSLHAIWSGSVALLMYRNQDYLEWSWEGASGFVIYYLSVAMVLHGVYDTLLKQDHQLLAVLTALVSFGWFQWTLSQTRQETGDF